MLGGAYLYLSVSYKARVRYMYCTQLDAEWEWPPAGAAVPKVPPSLSRGLQPAPNTYEQEFSIYNEE